MSRAIENNLLPGLESEKVAGIRRKSFVFALLFSLSLSFSRERTQPVMVRTPITNREGVNNAKHGPPASINRRTQTKKILPSSIPTIESSKE